jgi:glycosyltransferase involved in cell wall biosynthesis
MALTDRTPVSATPREHLIHPQRARVVYWNNIPAPYMVNRFNALVERGNIDLNVWFNARTEPDRHWEVDESSWRFPHSYIPHVYLRGHGVGFPPALLSRDVPSVLVSLHGEPSFTIGWEVARRRGIRTALWVVKTFDSWTTRRRYKEAMKRFIFSHTDAIFVPGDDGRDYALRYGAVDERIITMPHPVDTDFSRHLGGVAPDDRDRVRSELGLHGTTFIYVGRLWWGKGVESLLTAFGIAQRSDPDISLLIVGDGDNRTSLTELSRRLGLDNVVFTGFRPTSELPRLYAASDAFVFPTLGDPFGLVVDEAMSCGLPVISTAAAGEIASRIDEGRNGFIVPPDDSDRMAERMVQVAADPAGRQRMGRLSRQKVAARTPERWCAEFEAGVARVLELPRL